MVTFDAKNTKVKLKFDMSMFWMCIFNAYTFSTKQMCVTGYNNILFHMYKQWVMRKWQHCHNNHPYLVEMCVCLYKSPSSHKLFTTNLHISLSPIMWPWLNSPIIMIYDLIKELCVEIFRFCWIINRKYTPEIISLSPRSKYQRRTSRNALSINGQIQPHRNTSRYSNNSKAVSSALLENLEEMFLRYLY